MTRPRRSSVGNCTVCRNYIHPGLDPRENGPIGLDAPTSTVRAVSPRISMYSDTNTGSRVVRSREENKRRSSSRFACHGTGCVVSTLFATRSVHPSGTHRQSRHRRAFFFAECASDLLLSRDAPCDLRAAARVKTITWCRRNFTGCWIINPRYRSIENQYACVLFADRGASRRVTVKRHFSRRSLLLYKRPRIRCRRLSVLADRKIMLEDSVFVPDGSQ